MSAPLRIRPAGLHDLELLADLARRTFTDTYGSANDPADLARHLADNYAPEVLARELADPDVGLLLAWEGEALAGFAQLRSPTPPAEVPSGARQLQRFYVDRPWHGRGIAQALLAAARAEARTRGADGLWLTVWEHNPRALAFYRKAGFREVGVTVFHVGSDPQRDLLLVLPG